MLDLAHFITQLVVHYYFFTCVWLVWLVLGVKLHHCRHSYPFSLCLCLRVKHFPTLIHYLKNNFLVYWLNIVTTPHTENIRESTETVYIMRTSPKELKKKSNAKNNYCLNKCTCHTLRMNDENNAVWQVLVVFHKIIMTRKLLI